MTTGMWKRCVALVCALGVAAGGCNTKSSKVARFDPVPTPSVAARELEPIAPKSATELLRQADLAFREANKAQESGDSEAALRHYGKMLELLIDADLDPVIFYNLRNEFGKILNGSSQQAYLFERGKPDPLNDLAMIDTGVVGDLPIPFPLPEEVLKEIEEIQEVYPKSFQIGLNRSFRYAPYMRQELAKAGLPQDLVWLAMVESQYRTSAKSPAGAMGMWQFMSATGKRYGLRVDRYVDERRNWERCTQAAVAYLKDLYSMFGEWPLAVSAYNMGEYGMERAIAAANGEKDLWRILSSPAGQRHMRTETRKFYPRLVATVIVASSPERYGFSLDGETPPNVVRVPVTGMYSLAKLNRASQLPEGTLEELNQDLLLGVTPPAETYMVAVPFEANARFITALNEVGEERASEFRVASVEPERSEASVAKAATVRAPEQARSSSKSSSSSTYTVRRGDTISAIAAKYKVSSRDLMRANDIRSAHALRVGKRLTIPGFDADAVVASATSAEAGATVHRVQRGDTLSGIASRYKVSMNDLREWNSLSGTRIHANQELRVAPPEADQARATEPEVTPKTEEPGQTVETAGLTHRVAKGEFPGKIAERYGVSLDDLLEWNGLSRDSVIVENQELVVHAARASGVREAVEDAAVPTEGRRDREVAAVAQPSDAAAKTYKADRGDTAGKIAQAHGIKLSDFLAWNHMDAKSYVIAGKEYTVTPPGAVHVAAAKPGSSSAAADKPDSESAYKVEAGQSASTIAKAHGVSTADLLRWNGWTEKTVLKVGQGYVVRGAGQDAGMVTASAKSDEQGKKTIHKVAPGQNPTTIARRYRVEVDDLFKWNNWPKGHVLRVGDEVVVFD